MGDTSLSRVRKLERNFRRRRGQRKFARGAPKNVPVENPESLRPKAVMTKSGGFQLLYQGLGGARKRFDLKPTLNEKKKKKIFLKHSICPRGKKTAGDHTQRREEDLDRREKESGGPRILLTLLGPRRKKFRVRRMGLDRGPQPISPRKTRKTVIFPGLGPSPIPKGNSGSIGLG